MAKRAATARIRTSPAGNDLEAGFTLLELLVVLAILGGALALAVPAFDRLAPGVALRATARDTAAMLRHARDLAIAGNREIAVVVDLDRRSIGIDSSNTVERIDLDYGISLFSAAEERLDRGAGRIRFFPDGSSTGGRIGFSSGGARYDVIVSWVTGGVKIRD